jgi:ketosteroid isomerase-like protein
MKYHHLGIPTTTPRDGEYYLDSADVHVYDYRRSRYGVEWLRFGPGSTAPDLLKSVPHVAFEVDDLEAAIAGKDVIVPPNSPSAGVQVAFIVENGAPIEMLQYDQGAGEEDTASEKDEDVAATIISLERSALDRWGQGDPGGFIDLAADDIVYFDPFQRRRLDGREAFVRLMESIRGQVRFECYELVNPVVHASREFGLLTFNYISWPEAAMCRWNATEAYRKDGNAWRLIQQHWSLTGDDVAIPPGPNTMR